MFVHGSIELSTVLIVDEIRDQQVGVSQDWYTLKSLVSPQKTTKKLNDWGSPMVLSANLDSEI